MQAKEKKKNCKQTIILLERTLKMKDIFWFNYMKLITRLKVITHNTHTLSTVKQWLQIEMKIGKKYNYIKCVNVLNN